MGRFQGSLEYLIILGAAVLIAAIVVSYMFGLLRGQTKQNQQNTCTKFIKELCNAMLNPQTVGKTRSDEAVALYIKNNVFNSELTANVNVQTTGTNQVEVEGVTISVNPAQGTLEITDTGGFYVQSNGKIYFTTAADPIAQGDYACWGNGLSLSPQYEAQINCRKLA